jgi:hypothetical protein
MSVCSVNSGNQVDSSSSGYSPSSGYESEIQERRCLRVRINFKFPPIDLEDPVVITDFQGDGSYCKMRKSLTKLLKRPPFHKKIVWWFEECSKAHTHGFCYLFRRDGVVRMAEDL